MQAPPFPVSTNDVTVMTFKNRLVEAFYPHLLSYGLVRLTLDDMATEDNYFEGFLMMARKNDGTTMSVGTFDVLEQEYISALDCHDSSMVTHKISNFHIFK